MTAGFALNLTSLGRKWLGISACAVACCLSGCVTRKFTIDSMPQGALVYRDGKPIGTTPVDDYFVFHGKYRFTLVKDGYETLHVEQNIPAPWYEYAPLDFISENLVPWDIKDIHRFSYKLEPQQMPNNNDILLRAGDLRNRGKLLTPLHQETSPVPPGAGPTRVSPPGGSPAPSAPLPAPIPVAPSGPLSVTQADPLLPR